MNLAEQNEILRQQENIMPIMTEVRGKRELRFRWSKLRYDWGIWVFFTVPSLGRGWRAWEWERP